MADDNNKTNIPEGMSNLSDEEAIRSSLRRMRAKSPPTAMK